MGPCLQRHADRGLDAKHGFLLEARFVGRDDLLNGLARYGVIRMNKTQDIRGLTHDFTGRRSPLAGCLPCRESRRKPWGDYLAKKLRPVFRRDMTSRLFCPEVQPLLHGELPITAARRDVHRHTARERDKEQQRTQWIL